MLLRLQKHFNDSSEKGKKSRNGQKERERGDQAARIREKGGEKSRKETETEAKVTVFLQFLTV